MKEKILCPKCGEGIEKDSIECIYCGKEISDKKIENIQEETDETIKEKTTSKFFEDESMEELTENEALVKKLKTISIVIKFIFYLGAVIFVCMAFISGADNDSLIWANIMYAVLCFVFGLVGTVFIEWMALTLETLDKIKNKKK